MAYRDQGGVPHRDLVRQLHPPAQREAHLLLVHREPRLHRVRLPVLQLVSLVLQVLPLVVGRHPSVLPRLPLPTPLYLPVRLPLLEPEQHQPPVEKRVHPLRLWVVTLVVQVRPQLVVRQRHQPQCPLLTLEPQ